MGLWFESPRPARGWGREAHQRVNAAAVENLPEPLRAYFRARKLFLMGHSSDPDELSKSDPAERVHHFTDADAYEPFPFARLRKQFVDDPRGPTERQAREGDSIWQIDLYTRRLSEDWRRRHWEQGDQDAVFLAHYACDLTQPLHTTVNYDGQLTRQAGIHARFETELVSALSPSWKLAGAPPHFEANVRARIFRELLASYSARDQVLGADLRAVRGRSYADAGYSASFVKLAGPLAEQRLNAAVSFVSALWYTAWVRAGKPPLGPARSSR